MQAFVLKHRNIHINQHDLKDDILSFHFPCTHRLTPCWCHHRNSQLCLSNFYDEFLKVVQPEIKPQMGNQHIINYLKLLRKVLYLPLP